MGNGNWDKGKRPTGIVVRVGRLDPAKSARQSLSSRKLPILARMRMPTRSAVRPNTMAAEL